MHEANKDCLPFGDFSPGRFLVAHLETSVTQLPHLHHNLRWEQILERSGLELPL